MRMFGNGDANSVNIHLNIHSEDLDEECAQGMSVFYVNIKFTVDFIIIVKKK